MLNNQSYNKPFYPEALQRWPSPTAAIYFWLQLWPYKPNVHPTRMQTVTAGLQQYVLLQHTLV